MSYVSTRKRRDRHLLAQMKAIADASGTAQWDETRGELNRLPLRARAIVAWKLLWGAL